MQYDIIYNKFFSIFPEKYISGSGRGNPDEEYYFLNKSYLFGTFSHYIFQPLKSDIELNFATNDELISKMKTVAKDCKRIIENTSEDFKDRFKYYQQLLFIYKKIYNNYSSAIDLCFGRGMVILIFENYNKHCSISIYEDIMIKGILNEMSRGL